MKTLYFLNKICFLETRNAVDPDYRNQTERKMVRVNDSVELLRVT
jgi:hypothetical protein